MGLLDNGLAGVINGGAAGAGRGSGAEKYQRPLDVDDFDDFGGSLRAGKFVEIGSLETPAGIERRWGWGDPEHEANQGYAFGVFQDSDGVQQHVKLSLEWRNSTGRRTQVVEEVDSRDMDTDDRYDRSSQIPIPERVGKERASIHQELVVRAMPVGDTGDGDEIDAGNTVMRLPVTEYDVS